MRHSEEILAVEGDGLRERDGVEVDQSIEISRLPLLPDERGEWLALILAIWTVWILATSVASARCCCEIPFNFSIVVIICATRAATNRNSSSLMNE